MKKNKTVFIGCSSRDAIEEEYKELSIRISTIFSEHNYSLATGGASTGMMGKSYLVFHNNTQKVYAYTVAKYQDDDDYGYIVYKLRNK